MGEGKTAMIFEKINNGVLQDPGYRFSADPPKSRGPVFLNDRTIMLMNRFDKDRLLDRKYLIDSNGVPFLIEGTVTYRFYNMDNITKVKVNHGIPYTYEQTTTWTWTNYHDESDCETSTSPITIPDWDPQRWFSDRKWTDQITGPEFKTAISYPESGSIPYHALYYEGFDKYGWMVLYLRQCTEGYRLLRLCLKHPDTPQDIGFTERSINHFYQNSADNKDVVLFEDFLLNEQECIKIAAYSAFDNNPSALPGLKLYVNANPLRYAAFVRRIGEPVTEAYGISALMVQGLLRMRCLSFNDDYDYFAHSDI